MIQLTNPNVLLTHAATLAEYRLADHWEADIATLSNPGSDPNALALTFLKFTENPGSSHS